MKTVSPDQIAAWRKLFEAATPGEWEIWDGCSWRRIGVRGAQHLRPIVEPTKSPTDGHPDLIGPNLRDDLAFIAAARTGWPATLDALEAERERVKELEAGLKETLRMLEAAHRQLGMHSASNERVNRLRALLPEQTDGR